MTNLVSWIRPLIAMTVLVAAVSTTSRASAIITIAFPPSMGPGTVYIGQVVGDGRAWVAYQPNGGGQCTWWLVGGGLTGGLQDILYVLTSRSTSAGDFIFFPWPGTTTQFCGFDFAPLITNGWPVEATGREGNDVVANQVVPNVYADGGPGHDWVYNYTSTGSTSATNGFDGNDTLFGNSGDWMVGGNGNDGFCVTGTAKMANGGSGSDNLCGSAETETGIDSHTCPCGL